MNTTEIDLHRIELRYAHIRVTDESKIRKLAHSISQHGQIEGMLTVPGGSKGTCILIDGYQRQAALRYIGRDTGIITMSELSEKQTLFQLLRGSGKRQWETIEEAGLIQELYHRFDYSFSEIGKRIGRDKSYVKRRMDLLESLPEDVLKHVLSGVISTWAASRVLVPLARANPEDAKKLAAQLEHTPMSTRQLQAFYEHFQKANRQVRQRMLNSPSLFMKSNEFLNSSKKNEQGPEEKWLRDAGAVCGILQRLQQQTDVVFYPNQEEKLRCKLLERASRASKLTLELQQKIKERNSQLNPPAALVDKSN